MKQIDEILQKQLDKNMEFFMKYFSCSYQECW